MSSVTDRKPRKGELPARRAFRRKSKATHTSREKDGQSLIAFVNLLALVYDAQKVRTIAKRREDIMRKFLHTVTAAAVGISMATAASAQQFPERPIKMIVPWAAGGDTDNIFRPFAPLMQKHIGQPIVIANVGGASGTVGAREAKGSPADGSTLYAVHDYIHLTYYAGIADVKYSDFEPICLLAATASVLTASTKTSWTDFKGFVEDAKKRPGQISVGATLGSTSHIFPALVEKAAGVKLKYVSYDGLAPRMNAILGGHIDLTDSNLTQKGKVEAGQLRFIAIASAARDPGMPNVPTLKELGHNIVYEVVRGLLVPKGTPAPVRAKLGEACGKAAAEPAFAASMKAQGTRVAYLNAKDYGAFLDKIDAENKTVMTDLGLIKK
jgi:tripartite-type tricarboxylate transporter receptor subunit TctC